MWRVVGEQGVADIKGNFQCAAENFWVLLEIPFEQVKDKKPFHLPDFQDITAKSFFSPGYFKSLKLFSVFPLLGFFLSLTGKFMLHYVGSHFHEFK